MTDKSANYIANYDNEINNFKYIGIGPGLGKANKSSTFLKNLLSQSKAKKVIDADAINLIANDDKLLNMLDQNCLLTPHPGEFKRLVGKWDNDYDKLDKQRAFCKKHNCYMLLKGAYSSSCDNNGNIYFNDSGNPGLATAGSGDVLTGLILALMAQEYNLIEASLLGAYIHGLSADLAMSKESQESLISSDIISYFGKAFKTLY
jgi:NAD(P)H-hydrate epimerase